MRQDAVGRPSLRQGDVAGHGQLPTVLLGVLRDTGEARRFSSGDLLVPQERTPHGPSFKMEAAQFRLSTLWGDYTTKTDQRVSFFLISRHMELREYRRSVWQGTASWHCRALNRSSILHQGVVGDGMGDSATGHPDPDIFSRLVLLANFSSQCRGYTEAPSAITRQTGFHIWEDKPDCGPNPFLSWRGCRAPSHPWFDILRIASRISRTCRRTYAWS